MPVPQIASSLKSNTTFDLRVLETIPCGCVAGGYVASPWDVAVVVLEAKGHYCFHQHHHEGQVMRLGEIWEFDDDED